MITNQPNIILIIWDTARLDYARSYADNLLGLAESGIWFENAIAPANWTNPSHSSIFSGLYPHEHGVTQSGYMRTRTDIFSETAANGYTSYSVSSNNHFTYRTGFTESIDNNYYTRNPLIFADGLDTFDHVASTGPGGHLDAMSGLLREAIRKEGRIKNIANIIPVVAHYLQKQYIPQLQLIPHPATDPFINENRRSERDTKAIKNIISSVTGDSSRYFIFNNNTHLHFPYVSGKKYQQKHLDETLSRSELDRLNNSVAQNRAFSKLVDADDVPEDDVRTIRKLYAASVDEVDDHLGRILSHLEETGLSDDTLLIVTGDHGEDLGESDHTGRRRFGHGNSISDRVCRVPLVIYHPALKRERVEQPFSLRQLFPILKSASTAGETITTTEIIELCSECVFCEFPASGGIKSYQRRHPELSEDHIRRRTSMDVVAAYTQEDRYILNSDGEEAAFHRSNPVDPEHIPDCLTDETSRIIAELKKYSSQELSDESIRHLEEMGYI